MPDWIKRKDEDLLAQSLTFSQRLSADGAAYGISAEQAEELADKQAAFAEAMRLITQPNSDSTSNLFSKRVRRAELVDCMRALARVIRSRPGMTRQLLMEAGLRPGEGRRARVNGPDTPPTVMILAASGRTVTVRVSDAGHPARDAKPRDVTAAAVFGFVGEEPPATVAQWTPMGNKTRTTFTIEFNGRDVESGAKVWVTAAWLGTRQQPGPVGTPAYTYVCGKPILKLSVLRPAA